MKTVNLQDCDIETLKTLARSGQITEGQYVAEIERRAIKYNKGTS